MNSYRLKTILDQSHQLTLSICRAAEGFPDSASAAVVNRLQAVSAGVSENVASACAQTSDKGREVYLTIALGYADRLKYLLRLVRDLDWLPDARHRKEIEAVEDLRRALDSALQDIYYWSGS